MLTVVAYHYVRPIRDSQYPEIKGLEYDLFLQQLDYFSRFYVFITMEEIVNAYYREEKIPKNSILLTFDDGYLDHYQYVFPELMKRGIQGVFFPAVKTVLNQKALGINKIHFILAAVSDKLLLMNDIDQFIVLEDKKTASEKIRQYKQKYMLRDMWDSEEVCYIKKMLQFVIPEDRRNVLIDDLFKKYVPVSELSFVKENYLTVEQIQEMIRKGMYFGGHGVRHVWLEHLSLDQQALEIEKSRKLLLQIQSSLDHFIFCYPFGSYNEMTLQLLKENHCQLAFTIEPAMADVVLRKPLEIPRLDTNHFPKDANSDPNHLTLKVL